MTAQQQFETFLKKYDPAVAYEGKKCLAKLRKLVPGAIEMVYDNYNFLVVGFCPSMRPSEAIFSIVFTPRWVTLCFLQGKGLSDSEQRLRGSGNVVRNIRLEGGAKTMDDSYVRTLIGHALKRAKVGIPIGQKRQFIIKSVSAKQRPRRPAKEQGAHKQ
jgi:hypothetical protein